MSNEFFDPWINIDPNEKKRYFEEEQLDMFLITCPSIIYDIVQEFCEELYIDNSTKN